MIGLYFFNILEQNYFTELKKYLFFLKINMNTQNKDIMEKAILSFN